MPCIRCSGTIDTAPRRPGVRDPGREHLVRDPRLDRTIQDPGAHLNPLFSRRSAELPIVSAAFISKISELTQEGLDLYDFRVLALDDAGNCQMTNTYQPEL